MSGIGKIVAGNWKMNHGPAATTRFFAEFGAVPPGPRILIFPPALSLAAAVAASERPSHVELGVQNIHAAEAGAYTGENAAAMAREAGATLALIGHSERRQLFGETDAEVAAKITRALAEGLEPVVCVGETLAERRAGDLAAVLTRQVGAALEALPAGSPFILAYEPVWAIGTGETATPADASEAHGLIRARIEADREGRGAEVAILYGGSVKPDNAAELMAAEGVDGVLVGGASLDAPGFARIVDAARTVAGGA